MKTIENPFKRLLMAVTVGVSLIGFTACDKDDDDDDNMGSTELKSETFSYQFHNGQVVESAPYNGMHSSNLMADLSIMEMENGNAKVEVTLYNTMDGETYMVHAHDAADPANTPNNTPYDETPNADVLVQMAEGNGGTVTVSQESDMSFMELTSSYAGFFVVHDPLQAINTADISTYLIVGSFAREQSMVSYDSKTYSYDFNTGQVAPSLAYSGSHSDDLMAQLMVEELAGDRSRVSVVLMNTMNGETYPTHAHDKADPSSTPNNTPYDETPNADVFVQMIQGNGGEAKGSQISSKSFTEITSSYEAFFVVHDPLQAVNTADPTTYVILNNFARE